MKKLAILIFSLVLSLSLSAQSDADFVRKGRILVETGYNIVAGFEGGTGSSILFQDESTITSLGFNGGYFISEDFALKFGLGIISFGGSLTNFSVGGKYYIAGKAPVEVGAGFITGGGDSQFLGSISIGYGIPLAKNINLEPKIGVLVGDGAIGQFGINFALFL